MIYTVMIVPGKCLAKQCPRFSVVAEAPSAFR
jgi:hypothetical protein